MFCVIVGVNITCIAMKTDAYFVVQMFRVIGKQMNIYQEKLLTISITIRKNISQSSLYLLARLLFMSKEIEQQSLLISHSNKYGNLESKMFQIKKKKLLLCWHFEIIRNTRLSNQAQRNQMTYLVLSITDNFIYTGHHKGATQSRKKSRFTTTAPTT